jgi:phosphoglycolate phosphatase
MYSHILWDWNGTLLDDVDWAIAAANTLLAARSLPIIDRAAYYRHFTFPVRQYYKNIGFTFEEETFEDVSAQYIRLYHEGDADHCPLHRHVRETLAALSERGVRQVILSASEKGNLATQVGRYDIGGYFDDILGIDNIYAASKVEIGRAYLTRAAVKKALLIGDTLHDREVAAALGADCILIANGHQSRETLLTAGVPVLDDLSQLRLVHSA